MKKMILAVLACIGISFAGEFYCNDGSSNIEGISETSCVATSSNFTFGLLQAANGTANYYFVDFADITFTIGSEKNVVLRYIIHSNEPNFNAIQALTQTAFATNARLSVIFRNPGLAQNLTTVGPNGEKLCHRYMGKGSSMVCHVDAISILR